MNIATAKKEKLNSIVFYAVLALYFFALFYLFYNQLANASNGLFESDTLAHVNFAIVDKYYYSLSSFVYAILGLLPGMEITVSILLSAFTVGSVILTKKLLSKLFESYSVNCPEYLTELYSFVLNIVIGFYIKEANSRHYIGYQSGNMWHNSTYIFMRFFALVTLIYYSRIAEQYRKAFSFSNWSVFSLCLAVTTGFKPSFLTVFAPFLLVKLIYDWFILKTKFINVFKLGTTVFPAIVVMFIESAVLFPGDGNSGYMIAPFKALSMRGDHAKVTLVLSVLFPLTVMFFNIKNILKDKIYLGSLVIWAIGFFEVFLFIETGERAKDGNFFWGYSISLFILFTVSTVRSFVSYKQSVSKCKNVILAVQMLVLLWHAISGIWYFVLLLQGNTYFI